MPIKQIEEGTLEEYSLWYRYKTEVWPEESPQRDVVHNAMRVLRSIGGFKEGLAYASMPITTGRIFYEFLLQNPSVSKNELLEKAIWGNYRLGREFVESLRASLDYPVIFPADLTPVHQEWEQSHFQALWMSIIAELCTEVRMWRGWELSDGCVEEYVHVMQLRLGLPRHPRLIFYNTKENEVTARGRMKSIRVYDHLGRDIPIHLGIQFVEYAVRWLDGRRLSSEKMTRSLDALRWTDEMIRQGFYQ